MPDAAVSSASACVTAFSLAVTCAWARSTGLLSSAQPASPTAASTTPTTAAARNPGILAESVFTMCLRSLADVHHDTEVVSLTRNVDDGIPIGSAYWVERALPPRFGDA